MPSCLHVQEPVVSHFEMSDNLRDKALANQSRSLVSDPDRVDVYAFLPNHASFSNRSS